LAERPCNIAVCHISQSGRDGERKQGLLSEGGMRSIERGREREREEKKKEGRDRDC